MLVALANVAALRWPAGDFTILSVGVVHSDLDVGWLVWATIVSGVVLGAAWATAAHRILSRAELPPSRVDVGQGRSSRLSLVVAAVGLPTAAFQWLGMEPAIGALTFIGLGVATAVASATLVPAVRRYERRTGHVVLSTNPLGRGLGLESGPPVR